MKRATKIFLLITLITTIAGSFFIITQPLFAGNGSVKKSLQDTLEQSGGQAYYGQTQPPGVKTPAVIIGRIIQVVMGFLGLLFTVLILYSGFQWMMAGGNADTINKARQRIINAVIGLVIVLGVFMITEFILERALSSVA